MRFSIANHEQLCCPVESRHRCLKPVINNYPDRLSQFLMNQQNYKRGQSRFSAMAQPAPIVTFTCDANDAIYFYTMLSLSFSGSSDITSRFSSFLSSLRLASIKSFN